MAAAASAGPGASGSVRGRFPGRPWVGRSGNRAERIRVCFHGERNGEYAEASDPPQLRKVGLSMNLKRLKGACCGDSDSTEEVFKGFSSEEISCGRPLRSKKGQTSVVLQSLAPPAASPTKQECAALSNIKQFFIPEKVVRVHLTPLNPSICGLAKSSASLPPCNNPETSPKPSDSQSPSPSPNLENLHRQEDFSQDQNKISSKQKGRSLGAKNRMCSSEKNSVILRCRSKTNSLDFSQDLILQPDFSSKEQKTDDNGDFALRENSSSQMLTEKAEQSETLDAFSNASSESKCLNSSPPELSEADLHHTSVSRSRRAKRSTKGLISETSSALPNEPCTNLKRIQKDKQVPKVKWKLRAEHRQVNASESELPEKDQLQIVENNLEKAENLPLKVLPSVQLDMLTVVKEDKNLVEKKCILEDELPSKKIEVPPIKEETDEKEQKVIDKLAVDEQIMADHLEVAKTEDGSAKSEEQLPATEDSTSSLPESMPLSIKDTKATEDHMSEELKLSEVNSSLNEMDKTPVLADSSVQSKKITSLKKDKKIKLARSQKSERTAPQRLLAKIKEAESKIQPQAQSSKTMTRSSSIRQNHSIAMPVGVCSTRSRSSRVIKTPRRFLDELPSSLAQHKITLPVPNVDTSTSTLSVLGQEELSDSLPSLIDPCFNLLTKDTLKYLPPISPCTESTQTASSSSSSASSPSLQSTPSSSENKRKTILREPTFRWNSSNLPEPQSTPCSTKALFRLQSPASPEDPKPLASPASAPPSPLLVPSSPPTSKSESTKRLPLLRAPLFTPSEAHLKIYQSVSLQENSPPTNSSLATPTKIDPIDQKPSIMTNSALPEPGEILVMSPSKQSDTQHGGRRTNHLTLPLFVDTCSVNSDLPCSSSEPSLLIPDCTEPSPDLTETLNQVSNGSDATLVQSESYGMLDKPPDDVESIKIVQMDSPGVVCKMAIKEPSSEEDCSQENKPAEEVNDPCLSGTDEKVINLLEKAKMQLINIDKQKSADATHPKNTGAENVHKRSSSPLVQSEKKSRPQTGQGQESPVQGPRIKHVCRHPAVALGQPRAMIPEDIPRLSALPLSERKASVVSKAPQDESSSASEKEDHAVKWKPVKAEPVVVARRSKTTKKCRLRMTRCGNCKGCHVQDDCGKCINCLDKTKFGGPNTKKQCCVNRRCDLIEARKQERMAQKGRGVIRLPPPPKDSATESEDTFPDVWRSEETEASDKLESDQFKRKSSRRCAKQRSFYHLFPDSEESDYEPTRSAPRRRQGQDSDFLPQDSEEQSKPRRSQQQPLILRARKGLEQESSMNGNASKLKSVDGMHRLRVDFKEDCDLQNVWLMGGLSILTSVPVSPELMCLLCASRGHHELLYCQVCCEPFHSFCLEESERPLPEQEDAWCCRRCKFCYVCGRKGKTKKPLLECELCQTNYHVNCLGPNYPVKPPCSKDGWICSACIRCKSCGASLGKDGEVEVSEDGNLCSECSSLYQKGHFCPICTRCYEENDYESKMVQCAKCKKWVHSSCEELSDEGYEMLSNLPESIVYTCPSCLGSNSAIWKEAMISELTAGIHDVLQGLLTSSIAAPLLQCTQCSSQETSEKCDHTPCDLLSLGQLVEEGHYKSLCTFNEDMVWIIQNKVKQDSSLLECHGETIKDLYLKSMEKCFSWFHAEESIHWQSNKPITEGVLPNAVVPPYSDHMYAHWRSPSSICVTPKIESPSKVKKEVNVEPVKDTTEEKDIRQCALCLKFGDDEPKSAGRLLYIGQNEWTHINCAIWSAEVFEENDGSLKNVHAAVVRGRQMRCEYCSKTGATVGCCLSTCLSNFHFMCARASCCSFQDDKKMFCQKHTKLLDGTTVSPNDFDVLRRVYVDFEGISFKRKFLQGLEPESIHMMIGSMKVDSLGMLSDLSVCEGNIFPVGYQCSRLYWSTQDARRRCWYKCRVLEHRPKIGETHLEAEEDQGENRTIVHSPFSPPDTKLQETAFSPPPAAPSNTHGHLPSVEPVTTAAAPRSFMGARIKAPNYSPSRRPLGGSSRPLPSPGSPSSSPLSHHILTVSDPEVTPVRRTRRPAPPSRVMNQSSIRSSKDAISPSSYPITRVSSLESENPLQLLCDGNDFEVVSSLDGGLVIGPLQCGAQLTVGTDSPAESDGGSSSEDEAGDQYYKMTRTVKSQDSYNSCVPSATPGHIRQLDGIHDSTDSEDGSQGPHGTVGSGRTPSHLPSEIVDFVLKNTGNSVSPIQEPLVLPLLPPPSSSSTQNGNVSSLSNGTDCPPYLSSQGPPPLRDPPQLQRVCHPPVSIQKNPLHPPETSTVTVNQPPSKVLLVNKLGQIFVKVKEGSQESSVTSNLTSSLSKSEPQPTTPIRPPLRRKRVATKAAIKPTPPPNMNTVILQTAAPSPLTLRDGHSWTLSGPLLSYLPMLNLVQGSGHITFGTQTVMAPTLTSIPQTCVLQGLSVNTGLLGISSTSTQQQTQVRISPTTTQHQTQFSLIQPAPPPIQSALPPIQSAPPPIQSAPPPIQSAPPPIQSAPPPIQPAPSNVNQTPLICVKRSCPSSNNEAPKKKIKLEMDVTKVTNNVFPSFNCSSSTQPSIRPKRARIKAPMIRDVLNLDVPKEEPSTNNGLHPDVIMNFNIEDFKPESPKMSACTFSLQENISCFEEFSFREEKENHLPKKGGPYLCFEIISEDGFYIQTDSAESAWKAVLEKVQEARGVGRLRQVSFSSHMNGARMMGVQHDAVLFLLEQLCGAERCHGYKFLFHPQEAEEEVLPVNPSGCARSEVYVRKCTFDIFNFLASQHRTLPEIGPYEEEEEEVQLKSTRRATSLDLPMAMRFRHLKKTSKEAVGVYRSAIHGRGLFCKRNIDVGEMVIEYSGIVIRSVLTDKREKFYDSKGIGCYMFRIDDFDVVDATMHGNAARFINHSCEPNCYSRVIHVEGQKHIVIFALRSIYRGEELTYDYKFPIEDANNKLPCNCGAKKCRRFLN
ncbi:histone-lysine N-methyltransferase 2B isoform X2 [Bombina bombina]|uniref:histone-lysine N-methyltransferase 2B isoform X2 n=1 Tax=Bombina bombina TaxID=8345 RepID=UPI00235AD0C7|nr:histone-lysine N-methyltransferase 2B isoform X2 [Bombina bombina]